MRISRVHMSVFCYFWARVQSVSHVNFEFPTSVLCLAVNKYLQTGSKTAIKPHFNQSSTEVLGGSQHVFTSVLTDYGKHEIVEQQRQPWIRSKKTMSVPKLDPDWSKHIWGNQRAVVRVSKQCRPSSLLFTISRSRQYDGFFVFVAFLQGRGGSVLFGLFVFGGQWAVLLQIVMTQLSCQRASPQNKGFKGCKQVNGKMNLSMVAMPLRKQWKGVFENNDCACIALLLLSVTVVPLEQKQVHPRSASRRGKSDQGRANTGLSLQTLPVCYISFEEGTWHCWSNEMPNRIRGRDMMDAIL